MTSRAERATLLEAAGMTLLGEVWTVAGVTPESAVRSVIHQDFRPDVRVDHETADSVARTEQIWWDIARDVGVLTDDNALHLSPTCPGAFRVPWARVRAAAPGEFLRALQTEFGSLEFVTVCPTDGTVVGVFEEEDENWIVTSRGRP